MLNYCWPVLLLLHCSPFPTVAEAVQEELESYRAQEEDVKRLRSAMVRTLHSYSLVMVRTVYSYILPMVRTTHSYLGQGENCTLLYLAHGKNCALLCPGHAENCVLKYFSHGENCALSVMSQSQWSCEAALALCNVTSCSIDQPNFPRLFALLVSWAVDWENNKGDKSN